MKDYAHIGLPQSKVQMPVLFPFLFTADLNLPSLSDVQSVMQNLLVICETLVSCMKP